MATRVAALYRSIDAASQAVDDLASVGFTRDQISLLMSEGAREDYFPEETTRAPEGATAGGLLGAIAGGLVALVSLAVPGGIVVAGPVAAASGGAAAGGVGGGLVGALIGLGIPEKEAERYDVELGDRAILVMVDTFSTEQADRARRILNAAEPARTPTVTTLTSASPPSK